VNIQLNIVTCPTYPDKFIHRVVAPVVIVTLPCDFRLSLSHSPEQRRLRPTSGGSRNFEKGVGGT